MLIIGLLLIAAAIVAGSALVINGDGSTTIDTLGRTWHTTNAGVFLLGAGAMLALLVGVRLLQASLGRSHRRRREVKGLKRQNKSLAQVEEEKAALAAELEAERAARGADSSGFAEADGGRHSSFDEKAAADDGGDRSSRGPSGRARYVDGTPLDQRVSPMPAASEGDGREAKGGIDLTEQQARERSV